MFGFDDLRIVLEEHKVLPILKIEGVTDERSESALIYVMADMAEKAEKSQAKIMDARDVLEEQIEKGTVKIATKWFFPNMSQRKQYVEWAKKRYS